MSEAITKPNGCREGSCAFENTGHLRAVLKGATRAHLTLTEGLGAGGAFAGGPSK